MRLLFQSASILHQNQGYMLGRAGRREGAGASAKNATFFAANNSSVETVLGPSAVISRNVIEGILSPTLIVMEYSGLGLKEDFQRAYADVKTNTAPPPRVRVSTLAGRAGGQAIDQTP